MGDDKQETQPKKGDPVEIPVPERDDVMRDLRKMTKPPRTGTAAEAAAALVSARASSGSGRTPDPSP